MLKNVRHISEGNFYGLRVTNKAKNVSLDKKLRNLEACKDAQNHSYRKEEKDLINTLTRLQKSKEHYHHTDKLVKRHIEQHEDRKHERKLRKSSSTSLNLVDEVSPVGNSTNFPTQRRQSHGPTPMETSMQSYLSSQLRQKSPVPISMETGSNIHRTTGFTDCVICRLPRSSHVKGTDVCRCERGPDKGTHHMHPPAFHEDKQRPEYLNAKEKKELHQKTHAREHDERDVKARWTRRESNATETEQMFLEKLQREMHHAIESPLQLNKDYRFEPLSNGNNIDKGHANPRYRLNSMLEDERYRTRQDSIMEEGQYTIPRGQRRMSNDMYLFDSHKKRHDSSGNESYFSVGELKSRSSSVDDQGIRQTFQITHSAQFPSRPTPERSRADRRFSSLDDSHLPNISSSHVGRSTEAFSGLIHPDNIINHHHYLPHEADKPIKQQHHGSHHGHHHDDQDRHHDDPHHKRKRHLHGYYIHKYDHSGTRQIAHIPLGSNSHIAELLYKQHEPESNHHSLLSNLRQLLTVYKQLDETVPRYPWPTPPGSDMSIEEFQKLKDCRYLRLPKSMEDTMAESPSLNTTHW